MVTKTVVIFGLTQIKYSNNSFNINVKILPSDMYDIEPSVDSFDFLIILDY